MPKFTKKSAITRYWPNYEQCEMTPGVSEKAGWVMWKDVASLISAYKEVPRAIDGTRSPWHVVLQHLLVFRAYFHDRAEHAESEAERMLARGFLANCNVSLKALKENDEA